MAKAKTKAEKTLNIDDILFKCRDILRNAKNSGSFFEKRDMMLTLIFLRFIGEKFDDGIENLKKELVARGMDINDPNVKAAFIIRQKLIENDKVEAIIILPRELFITTDISVSFWILNENKKGGKYQNRTLRNRKNEILFMDLRSWTGDEWNNGVKNMQKKKFALTTEQILKAADIYHKCQEEGCDGKNYEEPELYKSVDFETIKANNFSLVPSRYIKFVDRDSNIDYDATLKETSSSVSELLKAHEQNTAKIKAAFEGLGYGI